MNTVLNRFVPIATAFLALAVMGPARAEEVHRLAQLGLLPPALGTVKKPAKPRTDAGYPGLRIPRSASRGLALMRDSDPREPLLYSGTRDAFQLGVGSSRIFGGMLYPLSSNWYSTLEASADAAARFPARGYGLVGEVHRSLPGGWDLSLGLHYNTYDSRISRVYGLGADTPLYGQTPMLHPATTSASGSAGYELRLNYRYGERNTLGVMYGSGSDLDYTRQLLGASPADGRQFGLTGEHWLTEDWALNYGVMAQEQIGPNRGQGLRLGLRYRF